ncbi:MAG: helix-turn-helix domain-containing protein [Flavisolibacter sp.]
MKKQASPYAPVFYAWNGVSAFFYYNNLTPFHSHNTLQLVFDLQDEFKCRLQNTPWQSYKAVAIKEDAIHQLDTNGSVQLILYLDPANMYGQAIKEKYLQKQEIDSIDLVISDIIMPGKMERILAEPNIQRMQEIVHELLDHITGSPKRSLADKRIECVLQLLKQQQAAGITIESLAQNVFLSPSRLRALFKSVTGFSLHKYLIWNRMMIAMTKLLNGETISEAAFASGFSDSSHFHRMLVQMFGITPSQFIKESSRKTIFIDRDDAFVLQTIFHEEI